MGFGFPRGHSGPGSRAGYSDPASTPHTHPPSSARSAPPAGFRSSYSDSAPRTSPGSGAGYSGSDPRPPAGSGAAHPDSSPSGSASLSRAHTDSSHYSFNGVSWDDEDPDSQTWMYARDARAQQAGLPPGRDFPYPSPYRNREELELSTPGSRPGHRGRPEWLHHPLTPGSSTTWTRGSGVRPGAVRSIYTAGDPSAFDVAFHNPKAGRTPAGSGKFSLANYHPAALKAAKTS